MARRKVDPGVHHKVDQGHAHSSQGARPGGFLQRTATGHLVNNRGVALVITLFVVALVAVLVLEYYFDASVELDLAANYASDAQAYSLALSGVNLAQVLLSRDDREADGPDDPWYRLGALPTCLPPQQLLLLLGEASSSASLVLEKPMSFVEATTSEAACVSLRIVDEQSKLPLNALVSQGPEQTPPGTNTPPPTPAGRTTPAGSTANAGQGKSPTTPAATGGGHANSDWEPVFKRLFENLRIEEDKLAAVIDWLDQDDVPFGLGGAENAYYETLKPRYKARNGPMRTPGELRLVRGFDFETLAKLFAADQRLPPPPEAMADIDLGNNIYVTPYGTDKVNVNTASPEVLEILLAALYEGSSSVSRDVKEIVAKRQEKQFDDFKQVKDLIIDATVQSKLERVADVKSTYFRVISTGMVGVIQKRVVVVLQRDQQETKIVYLKVE